MTNLISIIIPFYNAEAFLCKSIESIALQTDPSFELILVNDGSADKSVDVASRWIQQDDRISLYQKTNGGVSSARNLGLAKARGSWVLFVDADDTVEPDFVATMRSLMNQNELVVCAYDRVSPLKTVPFVLPAELSLSIERLYEHSLCTQLINGGCCNKAFRLDLIREHGLLFDERFSVGEDMVFLADYFALCSHVGYVGRVIYHYTDNALSLTQSSISQRQVTGRDASVLTAMDLLVHKLKSQNKKIMSYGGFRRVRSSLRLLFLMALSSQAEPKWLRVIGQHTRAGLWDFLQSPHARWIERLVAVSVAISPTMTLYVASVLAKTRSRLLVDIRK